MLTEFPDVYIPSLFNESRIEVLHGLITENPMGLLVTHSHY